MVNREKPVAIMAMFIDPPDPIDEVPVRCLVSDELTWNLNDLPADLLRILAKDISELSVSFRLTYRSRESS